MNEKFCVGADTSILLSNYQFKKVSEFLKMDEIHGNKIIKKEYIKSPENMYRII